jgi:small subunit ribosomal protein SAe
MLTNYQTKQFKEPRLMVVANPFSDRKAIIESSYMNIPVIALCDSNTNLQYVDIAIPCNNKFTESISMIFWLLAREVRILTGKQGADDGWDIKVDLFYHKTLEEAQKYEKEQIEADAAKANQGEEGEEGEDDQDVNWEDNEMGGDDDFGGNGSDWGDDGN